MGLLSSIKESSREMSQRSTRESSQSINSASGINKPNPGRISSTNGYDYLGSIIEPKTMESDSESWSNSDSSLIKNQQEENQNSLLNFASSRRESTEDTEEIIFENIPKNASDPEGNVANAIDLDATNKIANSSNVSLALDDSIISSGRLQSHERVSVDSAITNGSDATKERMSEDSWDQPSITSNGRTMNRHSTLSSLRDVTEGIRLSKDDSYVGYMNRNNSNNRHSTLGSLRSGPSFSFRSHNINSARLNDSATSLASPSSAGSSSRFNYSAHSTASRPRMYDYDSKNSLVTSTRSHQSAMKKGPKNRSAGVSFKDNVLNGRGKVRDSVLHSNMDPSEVMKGSEELFAEPERRNRHVNFSSATNLTKDSMADELAELERYLSTLKQSIVETKRSMNITTPGRSQSAIDKDRPRLDSNSNNPKSRRRFSMAYRTTDEVVTFPDDCFSFLIVHGPIDSPYFFFFGLMISMLQLGFLILALLSMVHPVWTATGSTDNPQAFWFYFPANVSGVVRMTQILAVVSYCLFADMSVKDYLTALDLFPQRDKLTKNDKYWCMAFSCVLRFAMGFMTIVVTLIMLLTNTSVIDTILDFLAMNFISDIGKMAFQLCLWGKYGRRLEAEARRLEDMSLPQCMLRPQTQKRYKMMVTPIVILAFAILISLITAQASDKIWTTDTFRVQIVDNPDLEPYNGCYIANGYRDTLINNRLQFDSFEDNAEFARLGYCRTSSQWYLYKSDHHNPCNLTSAEIVLQSSLTSYFDINGAKSSTWSDNLGSPLSLYFFSGSKDEILSTCGSFLHDGRCDSIFNDFENRYDGGDCCSSTCTGANCGAGVLKYAFGTPIEYGDGFPDCLDPDMKPITIKIEGIVDSFTYDEEQEPNDNTGENVAISRSSMTSSSVIEPIMILDCDDKNVLTVHVNKNMEGQMETVLVEDGANCTMRINNSTSSSLFNENPIWYVNYTIYDGDHIDVQENPIVIREGNSADMEFMSFPLLPGCYFRKLSNYLDNSTIYTGTGPENQAIKWMRLVSRISRNSDCEDEMFTERYALSVLNFAAPVLPEAADDPVSEEASAPAIEINIGDNSLETTDIAPVFSDVARYALKQHSVWVEATRQCIWRTVSCTNRTVSTLDLHRSNLEGTIASSIGILTNLERVDLDINRLQGPIPSEIGLMESLHTLSIASNYISGTIPIEIANADALEVLTLTDNVMKGTIPTDIGLLTSMETLDLSNNFFSGIIPSEIGAMTALNSLDLSGNLLSGTIPSEIGALALKHNLTQVYVANNAGLIIPLDMAGLRDVVYTACPTDACVPRNFATADETVTTHCQALLQDYETYKQQLPIDVCEMLKSNCLICN